MPLHSSLGDRVRLCFKKIKKRKGKECFIGLCGNKNGEYIRVYRGKFQFYGEPYLRKKPRNYEHRIVRVHAFQGLGRGLCK